MTNDMTTQDKPNALAVMAEVVADGMARAKLCESGVKDLNASSEKRGALSHLAGRDRMAGLVQGLLTPCSEYQGVDPNGNPMTGRMWLTAQITRLLANPLYKRNDAEMGLAFDVLEGLLGDHPMHAVQDALWWWVSGRNPRSGWFPDAGEIERQVIENMKAVKEAQSKIGLFDWALRESGLESVAKQIAGGDYPSLADFDALLAERSIDLDIADPQRGNTFVMARHVAWLAKNMRDAILANGGDVAPAPKTPLADLPPLDVDKEVDRLEKRCGEIQREHKRKHGWKGVSQAGAAKAFMDKAGGVQK